eukprot:s2791_g5.t2
MGYHILIVDSVGLAQQEVTLRGLGQVSAACGALFGGLLADLMARCLPSHGRILVAQASVALILPMCFFAMKASPNTGWELLYQASFTSGIGFTSTWITGACLPIVVDLAPTGRKSGIIAWQMALEQVFSVAAACIIGVFAPKIAGHELPGVQTALSLAVQQIVDIIRLTHNREGFAMAVFAMMALLWGLALCCYSLLHWSYPRDWYRVAGVRSGSGLPEKWPASQKEALIRKLFSGSFVVATSDFDPDDIQWPETWGVPLPLKKSVAIRIISDGGDRAFGHYVGQPERRGYFLKHLTEALSESAPSAKPSIEMIEQPFSKAHVPHVQLPHVSHVSHVPHVQGVQSVQSQIQHRSLSELSPPQPHSKSGRIPSEASTSIPCSPKSPGYSPTSPFVPDQTPVGLTSFPPLTSPHPSLSATEERRLDSLDRDEVHKCEKPEASKAHETSSRSRPRGTLQTPSSHSELFSLPHVPKLEPFKPVEPESRHSSALGANPMPRNPRMPEESAIEIPHQEDMDGRLTDFRGVKAEDKGALSAIGAMNESHPRCQSTFVRSRQLRQLETQPERDPLAPVAAALGLDPQTEEHLVWLVDAAASVELPEGWITFADDDGRAVYYHERKLFVTRKHPMLQRLKVYAEQLQRFYQTLSSKALNNNAKIRAHLAVILNEVLNRCHRELPPMTPVLLERTAVLLGIDTTSEFVLSSKVKTAIESFAEDQYDISVATHQKADVDSFTKNLRAEQIQAECMDFFSLEGFQKCHASGKRRQHHPLKVEQCACSVFPREPATCKVEGQYYSDQGYDVAVQRHPHLEKKHCDFFCMEAFWERHGHGHRQQHSCLQLDRAGILHRFGQPLPPLEDSSQKKEKLDNTERNSGPWLAFRDDQLTTYWYHLRDKVVTFENPYFGSRRINGMQIGSFQEKGVGKAQMEDRMIVRAGIPVEAVGASCKKAVVSLFGVFDGHSGASCSDFVATNLDRIVFECIRHQMKREVSSDMAMRSALQAAFRTTEHNFFQYANRLEAGPAAAWANAGSTASTCTFYGPDEDGRLRLAVANAGDSRAVLGRKDCRAVRLSEDHTPDVPGERKRIEAEGAAVVQASGIWRIVLPSKKGTGLAGLSVSRGFGDIEYKTGANVVSAVPDIFVSTLDLREDCFVVIASDGVWGPVTDGEAVRIVASVLREGGEDPAANAARQLLEVAHHRDGHDDKTVLVIWFGDLPLPPPVDKVTAYPTRVVQVRHEDSGQAD